MSDVDLVYRATLDGSGFSSGSSSIISQLGMMGSSAGVATVAITALAAAVAGIGAVIVGSTMAFSAFQQSAADLNKIMGGTADQQKTIADNMRQMSVESGTAVTQLLGVAASLSALGIETQNLTSATEVVNQMGIALGLSNDEAASYMAGLNTLYGTSVENWSRIASGINEVENSTSATSRGMLNFANEFAPLAKQFNVTDKEALALGSTFEALKIPTEQAATSLRSAFTVASADPKKMTAWSELMGISVKDLTNSLDRDFIGTMLKSAAAINEIESGSEKAAKTHEIWGSYGMQSIALLGDQTATYTENLNTLNQAYEENTSIAQEVETRNNTLLGSWNKAKAAINDLGITIGETTQGPIKGILDGFTAMYPALQQGVQSLVSGDFGGFGQMISNIGSSIVDYFRNIDYKAIGESIHQNLHKAWDVAKSLFSALINSDASFAGIFSALGDILRPTFESIFGTMEIAAKKALIAIGDAFINAWNSIGSALYGIYNKIVGIFSDLVGAVGEAWGWIEGKLDTLKSYLPGSSSSGGAEFNAAGTPTRLYSYETGNTETYTNPKTIERLLASGNYRIETGTVSINSASISIASANDLRTSDALSEMYGDSSKLHVQSVGDGGWLDRNVLTPIADQLKSTDDKINAFGDKVEKEGVIGASKEAITGAITGTADQVGEGIDNLQDVGREGNTRTADMHEWQKSFLDRYERKYEDYESEAWNTLKGQWQTDIAQLESQKAAEAYLKEAGLDDTKAAKDLEKTIEATGEKVAADIAASVSGVADALYDPMYKASFQGQTKDYGATAQENMQRQAEAALVNAQYGIVAVGSMNEYTQYAKEGLAAAGIEQISIKSLIDDAIAGLKEEKSTVDDTIASTNDLKAASKEVDFAEAKAGAEDLKSTCVEVEFSMENIAATASQIKFSRSASASPDALKQGIFETSDTDPRRGQPQMAGANAAAGGLSNAALSAMQRYLSQVANNTNRIYNGINTYGRSIFSAVQLAGTNAAAAVNANGSNIASTVNSQGGAIVGAINAGVAALIKVLSDKGSGNMGGPHAGMGGLGSVGSVWDGLNPSAGSLALEYGIFETAYSEGGYASRPTIALVGDSPGGEFMVPRDRVGEFVNSYMSHQQTKIDGSGMGSQLMDAVGSLNVPAIHIPVVVDIDSEAIFEAVEYAFKSISSDIRLRARV